MRTSAAEKHEIIRMVEEAALPAKRVLAELDVARCTFYRWFKRYQEAGYDGKMPIHMPAATGIVFPTMYGRRWCIPRWRSLNCRRVS